jgi:hypothetical protein
MIRRNKELRRKAMKRLLLCLVAILCSAPLFADIIFLTDGTEISGKVLRVSETAVEFSTAEVPFDMKSRNIVIKIVYTNGKVVEFDARSSADVSVPAAKPEVLPTLPIMKPHTFSINIFGGLGGVWSPMEKKEHDSYVVETTDYRGKTYHDRPGYYMADAGVFFDCIPLTFIERENFFIKGGFRSLYSYNSHHQEIIVSHYESEDSYTAGSGRFLTYHSFCAGPVVSVNLTGSTSRKRWGVTDSDEPFGLYLALKTFAVAGPVFKGKAAPGTAAADAGLIDRLPTTTFHGTKLCAGGGMEFGLGAINFGFNLSYSRCWITLKDKVYDDIGRKTTLNELTFDLYTGASF